jgi:MoaD family protein
MVTVKIPTPLRPYTDGNQVVELQGDTVGDVIGKLTERYPGLEKHLFDDEGHLRPYVNVFLNQEDVRTLQGEDTPVKAGDQLMIIPSIAGGKENDVIILYSDAFSQP